MAVDEPGHDGAAAEVEATIGRWRVNRAPHPLDDSVDGDHRGIPEEAEALRHRRGGIHGDGAVGAGAGDELTDPGDEHGVGCRATPRTHGSRGSGGGHRRTAAIASCSNEPTSPRRC